MDTPLDASATTVGSLMASSTFLVPEYQREYKWTFDEVDDFWNDLNGSYETKSYFLGLVILTKENEEKHIVDGQQRILTIQLLANALRLEALAIERNALAEKIRSDFLQAVDYETDGIRSRVRLSDKQDNETFEKIINAHSQKELEDLTFPDPENNSLLKAFRRIQLKLKSNLENDENKFKRIGVWTDYLTNYVYLAVFVHPDSESAYRVFEVMNLRGRELTPADLLKSFVLNNVQPENKSDTYIDWQLISKQFNNIGPGAFVQYIRHVITLRAGYILPRDLYKYISQGSTSTSNANSDNEQNESDSEKTLAPAPEELVSEIKGWMPLYLQFLDPTLEGPADSSALDIFAAVQELDVLSVRPVLMALSKVPNSFQGMDYLLRIVGTRIIVGNLGTGNIERRFSEAARRTLNSGDWKTGLLDLEDLMPTKDEFAEKLRSRAFNKSTLSFIRRSTIQNTITPKSEGTLYLVRPRYAENWANFSDEDFAAYGTTLGNTFISKSEKRPQGADTWEGFRREVLTQNVASEVSQRLNTYENWSVKTLKQEVELLSETAANIWYPEERLK